MNTQAIDIVVPWVNSNDPKWINKKEKYINCNTEEQIETSSSNERYRDYGTLKYLFRSIEKNAPWIRKIFLVTDNQIPDLLNVTNKKVKVIDHKEIIDNKYLPVFNSSVIEMNIYKIKELSENFIYFNDDMLLNKTVTPKDFFLNGKPRDYRIYTSIVPKEGFMHILVNDDILINRFVKGRWPISKYGLTSIKYGANQLRNLVFYPQLKYSGIPGYLDPHGPLSFNKKFFYIAKKIWPKELEKNNAHKFRQYDDVTIWLIRYLQLELGNFVTRNTSFNGRYTINDVDKISKDLDQCRSKTICINDTHVKDYEVKAKMIQKVLERKYPKKSSFER